MKMTRRKFLKLGLVGGAGLALSAGALGACQTVRTPRSSPLVVPFRVPLPIPPVLEPVRSDGTTDHYEITQKVGKQEILPGLKTEVWGYDGIFPGPTFEARSGRRVVVRQINELPVPVVTHLHGGVTPPESDGYPTDLIFLAGYEHGPSAHAGQENAGEHAHLFKDYEYPNQQGAATLWYHDHRMDFTGPQVYKGLAGLYLIRDEVEDGLPLPKGEKEMPLVICDRIYEEDGSLFYPSIDPSLKGEPGVLEGYTNGVEGDTVLVNGAPWPFLEVSNTRYRFRILNASNARQYELALDPPPPGGMPFVQIGSDGGLLEMPIHHDRLLVSQAERFDVIVDFSRYPVGTRVTLKNLFGWRNRSGIARTSEVMRFVVARQEKDESFVPERLAPQGELPDPAEADATRRFSFSTNGRVWAVNGEPFDPERIDARPRLGAVEVWELSGETIHPIHLHLVQFRVLSRGGGKPGPYDAGWKDTVFLGADANVRVAARFSGYRGKYPFHCHNLEHEDMMMANFEVV